MCKESKIQKMQLYRVYYKIVKSISNIRKTYTVTKISYESGIEAVDCGIV